MLDEKMEPDVCKGILYGAPNPLNSSYHISYNMLLNLMRVEDVDPEYLLRASFFQFQRELEVPNLIHQAEEFEKQADSVDLGIEEDELIAEYYKMDKQLDTVRKKIAATTRRPQHLQRFMQGGRFMSVSINNEDYGWGVLVSQKKINVKVPNGTSRTAQELQLDVILRCVDRNKDAARGEEKEGMGEHLNLSWRGDSRSCRPCQEDEDCDCSWRIFTISLDSVDRISAIKIVMPGDCTRKEARDKVGLMLKEAKRRFQGDFQLLDPITDLGINDDEFQVLVSRAEALSKALAEHRLSAAFQPEKVREMVITYDSKQELVRKAKLLRDEARASQTIAMKDDMRKMKRVLKKLGHVDSNGIIQTKGRTACEINTANGTCS